MEYKHLDVTYAIDQDVLDGALLMCKKLQGTPEYDKKLAGFLKSGASIVKTAEKVQRSAALEDKLDAARQDPLFQVYAADLVTEYAAKQTEYAEYSEELGFTVKPRKSGVGYYGYVDTDNLDIPTLVRVCGTSWSVTPEVKDDAPDGASPDNENVELLVKVELPDLDKSMSFVRELRQKALDVVTEYTKDLPETPVVGIDPATGELTTSKSFKGERATPSSVAPKGQRIWAIAKSTGKRYEGTNKEVFDAMKSDGITFSASAVPASIQNDQATKQVSSWGKLD